MKRIFSFFVVLSFLLLFISANAPRHYGLVCGKLAPEVVLGDSTLYNPIAQQEGYTLLHFWASHDAPSRIANIRYNNVVEQLGNDRLRYIAVSYEGNEILHNEIVRRDKLASASQYYDKGGETSSLYARYRLKKGFASYLIDASGSIIARDPSPQQLEHIMGQ